MSRIYAIAVIGALTLASATVARAAEPEGVLLVANADEAQGRKAEGYVSVVDPETGAVLAKIPDGGVMAHELVSTTDGRFVYAPIYGTGAVGGAGLDGSTISIIDVAQRKVVGQIDLGHPARPHFGVTSDKDGLIYITTELDQAVIIVDPKTRKVVGSVPTGQPQSHNVAISHDGLRAYTSNVYEGTVSFLDVKARKLKQVVRVTPAGKPATGTTANWGVQRLGVSNDDKTIFTCDWITSDLVALDAFSGKILSRTRLPSPCYGLTPTPDGKSLILANYTSAQLTVVDLQTMTVARQIPMPEQPQAVLIRPDHRFAYVTCASSRKIARLDLTTWTVDKVFDTGNYPDGMAWGRVASR